MPGGGADEPTVALDPSPGSETTTTPAHARTGSGSTARTTAGPARGPATAGTRTARRSGSHVAASSSGRGASVLHRTVRANLTARALALVVVLLVLTISYATSLRIYFAQAHEIASTKAEIAQRQSTITELQGQITRWDDPAYVSAQARERLGWLVPGETGYTVVGPDGKPLGGGMTLEASTGDEPQTQQRMWWDRMWGSVKTADKPAAKKQDPAERAPVTPSTKPR